MAKAEPLTTRVSTKGQVILPKSIRSARHWHAGTELVVENVADGVLLKAAPLFPETQVSDVFGCLHYSGPPISLRQMEAALTAEAKRRARD
jgi:AbrB family looped-hinge helix DNA binding protein